MPRKAKANGRPSDFAAGAYLPVATPTGQAYGEATKLANAQKAVPLPNLDQQPNAAGSAGGAGLPQVATAFDPFHGVTPLSAPSSAPHEPVTAGAPVGPGPGPEALSSTQDRSVAAALTAIAQAKADPELANYAMQARQQGV